MRKGHASDLDPTRALSVFDIDVLRVARVYAEALLGSERFCLTEAEFKSFVGADVEERTRKQGNDLSVNLPNEIVGLGIGRREHVSVGSFSELGINFIFQQLMKMPEGLLLGQKGDAVLVCVVDQLRNFGRS